MALKKELKLQYNEDIKDFKQRIEEIKKEINFYKAQQKKHPELENYYQLGVVLEFIKYINTCILINDLSVNLLGIKSQNYLEDARKGLYSVFQIMDKVVGNDIEGGLDENKALLDRIPEFTPLHKLNFLKAQKELVNKIIDSFGENTKWRWSWPELHFKLAVLAKNLMDFRAFEKDRDINSPNYYVFREHYAYIVELCNIAAQEYRMKFDLSTNDTGDLRKSVSLLDLVRRIYMITGRTDDLGRTKTLIESLNNKIDAIESEKDKNKKKKK